MVCIELTKSGASIAVTVTTAQPEFFDANNWKVTIESVMKSNSAMFSSWYSISTIRLHYSDTRLVV